jgi:tetratricopeptide (TPR) repeat protein
MRRNFQGAIAYYEKALSTQREIGDRAGVGASLLNIAQILSHLGDHSKAELMLREALKMQQALNSRWWETNIWNELGVLYLIVGDLTQSQHCLEQGLALSRQIGYETGQAYLLCNLGQVLRDGGELEQADQTLAEGLRFAQAQGDAHLEAICLNDLALLNLRRQHFVQVIEQAQASLVIFRALNLELSTTSDLATLAVAQLALGNRTEALSLARETLQILDMCNGEGPDFPQRDYWMCYEVLQSLGESVLARHALESAHRLLAERTQRISDPNMRVSFLDNISIHRRIVHAGKQLAL